MSERLLSELTDWLRIPSISTGAGDPAQLVRAAEWARQKITAAGGQACLQRVNDGNPLVLGELACGNASAPRVLIYGHYDVQDPGERDAWLSDPFAPEIRDGRLYARGAADDKGNFFPLLFAACQLAREGALKVNVRVLLEGEEEVGSASAIAFIREDSAPLDAAIVFDSGMVDSRTPAITVGLRGMVQMQLVLRTARRNLHSGLYGGSVRNALHVLHRCLAQVLPDGDGRLREELRAGVLAPEDEEVRSWQALPSGDEVIADSGGQPLSASSGKDFYLRNGADASLDVNELCGGEPRTIVPAIAKATITQRLAPRQDPNAIAETLERLLRGALPEGAELSIDSHLGSPTLFDMNAPALRLAGLALARACGVAPAYVRSGGSIPIVAEMAEKGYPVIVSGFSLLEDAIHAPNESFSLRSLELCEASSRELLNALAGLEGVGAGS